MTQRQKNLQAWKEMKKFYEIQLRGIKKLIAMCDHQIRKLSKKAKK